MIVVCIAIHVGSFLGFLIGWFAVPFLWPRVTMGRSYFGSQCGSEAVLPGHRIVRHGGRRHSMSRVYA